MDTAILLISCPDQKGLTAGVTNFIFEHGGNILHADQHIDEQSNIFFMRVEWDLKNFALVQDKLTEAFEPLGNNFDMDWQLHFSTNKPRVAVFVSKHLHCLLDVLIRHSQGQLPCEIPLIISNHPDAKPIADEFNIDFHQFEITRENKSSQEQKEIQLLKKDGIDLVVLARYHQILSKEFVNTFENRILNIHHSFLPAFPGKNPYARAYDKGVKIIGATSHFVTEHLDEGPIIEQDITRVSHRASLKDFVMKGEDLEKLVLSRALRLVLTRKVLCYGNKTVVFD